MSAATMDPQQRELWAQEVKKTEERCQMFKDQALHAESINRELQQQIANLEDKVLTRDDEIRRLQIQYQGGQSFENIKTVSDIDRIGQERQRLVENFEDIANMLDMSNFRIESGHAPVNFDQINQIILTIQSLKGRLDDAKHDNMELSKQVERLQSDQYNQASLGNMMNEQEANNLKASIRDLEDNLIKVQDENRTLRV